MAIGESLGTANGLNTSQAAEQRFRALVQHAPDIIALFDGDGVLSYASPSLTRILGYDPGDLVGVASPETVHADDFHAVGHAFAAAMAEPGAPAPVAFRAKTKDGSYRHLEATFTNLFGVPAVDAMVINARDVTERVEATAALLHQAFHDALTDLPNRALFLDRVTQALARAERTGSAVAVVFLDLDDFASINRLFGRDGGDHVLASAAGLLDAAVRGGDTVACLGGDEFVVCCEEVGDASHAVSLAARLGQAISVPFGSNGLAVTVTASIGIALSGRDGLDTADSLLRDADAAMYQAKQRGRNRVELFDPAMRARTAARAEAAAALRTGLAHGELVVHYQPLITLDTGRVVGIEALARWERPSGFVPPAEFIPVAEESGLIVELGQRVLTLACGDTAAWNADHPDHPLSVAVNLSVHQLGPGVVDVVAAALEVSGLTPELLCLEITESALMDDAEVVGAALHELKGLGVRLGVDDFGTGYSSLLYLRGFPIDVLKIDRSFVSGMEEVDADAAIVEGVLSLAHALGLEAVAEGVETAEQAARLRNLGCELGQGYLWSPPLAPDVLYAWMEAARGGARLAV
jgi:diguanylate cyclase (GGDEF)-like protein/PAS domain S-box-containing protein